MPDTMQGDGIRRDIRGDVIRLDMTVDVVCGADVAGVPSNLVPQSRGAAAGSFRAMGLRGGHDPDPRDGSAMLEAIARVARVPEGAA